mgnify:CR=1 FL=1
MTIVYRVVLALLLDSALAPHAQVHKTAYIPGDFVIGALFSVHQQVRTGPSALQRRLYCLELPAKLV